MWQERTARRLRNKRHSTDTHDVIDRELTLASPDRMFGLGPRQSTKVCSENVRLSFLEKPRRASKVARPSGRGYAGDRRPGVRRAWSEAAPSLVLRCSSADEPALDLRLVGMFGNRRLFGLIVALFLPPLVGGILLVLGCVAVPGPSETNEPLRSI